MSRDIVDPWLQRFVASALDGNLDAHMAMISPQVLVFGVPEFDTLGFDDWRRQCEHEFPQRLIRSLDYDRIDVRSGDPQRILFRSRETTVTAESDRIIQGVEMLLQRENGDWKLRQLRVLPDDEARHAGLV